MNELIEKILEYVEPDGEITAASRLKYDCGLTSFDMTCLVTDLCTEKGVDYKTIDAASLKTVGDLAAALGIEG